MVHRHRSVVQEASPCDTRTKKCFSGFASGMVVSFAISWRVVELRSDDDQERGLEELTVDSVAHLYCTANPLEML